MQVSVIVPVYNVEDYLHYAIESLVNQTYQDFEVILVNDGSTDESGKLCDEYALKYKNIFSYHKENGGLSDARNFGIKKSKGEFITFLDPDDYLESYALELFMKIQSRYKVDIVSTRVESTNKYNDYTEYVLRDKDYSNVVLFNRKEFLLEVLYDVIATVSACGKLYRKSILKKQFPKGKIYEDLYIISEHLLETKKIAHTNIKIYNYYSRVGSIVNSGFSDKQYDFFKAIEHNKEIIKKYYYDDKELQKALIAKKLWALKFVNEVENDEDNIKKIKTMLSKQYYNIITNKRVSNKTKMKYTLFLLSPKIYYSFRKIIKGR